MKEERDYDYARLGKILADICVTSLISVIAPISTESRKFSLANSEFISRQRDCISKERRYFLVENGVIKI